MNGLKGKILTLIFCSSFVIFASRCGGGGGGEDEECQNLPNSCEQEGQKQCSSDGTAIEQCTKNEDGCLVWQTIQSCGDDEQCIETDGTPACTCVDQCPEEGQKRCNDDNTIVQVCQTGSNGCLQWVDETNCQEQGLVCGVDDGEVGCIAGCTDQCTEGESRCNVTIIQQCQVGESGCLEWVDTIDCADTDQICDDSSGIAQCVDECTNECETEGTSGCEGDVIYNCVMGEDGCLDWVEGEDCAASDLICQEEDGSASCVCPEICTEGETRCSGSMIQTCIQQENGCYDFTDSFDCGLYGLSCDDSAEPAICLNGGGDSCDDVEYIFETPFVKSGDDITADYTDSLDLGGTDCTERTDSVEAVFGIYLTAGQEVIVRELGEVDVVISILAECSSTAQCLVSEDYGEATGVSYTATEDGIVYIVVETYYFDPFYTDYEIHIDIPSPEDCGDGIDNDIDGKVDCDDSDCFGDPTYCTTETNCTDDEDNDADGDVDCDDSDCSSSPYCSPYKGYWEEFGSGDPVDLEGHGIIFTPESTDVNLYTWETADSITDYPETPGSGSATTTLTLGDSDSVEYTFSIMTEFRFFDIPYTSLFVGSNGFITFGEGDDYSDSTIENFFDYPRIAGLDVDLDPPSGGTISVDEFSDRIVVTFDAVPEYWSDDTVSFQIILRASGVIEIYYIDMQYTDGGFVGISNGAGNGTYPDETDFIPPPPPPPPTINEICYDSDGTDDKEFVEIFGQADMDLSGYTLVHFNGSDGSIIWEISLDGHSIPSDGFFVIGSSLVENVDLAWTDAGLSSETNVMQNDGENLVLYTGWDGSTGTVVDAVGYEDPTNFMGENAPAGGIAFGNWNNSIGRYEDGNDTDDNSADLQGSWWPTPGEPNTPPQPDPSSYSRITASSLGNDALPVLIADNDPTGVSLTIDTPGWAPTTVTDIHVGVKIKHGWIGDLVVNLISPAGTVVKLHDKSGFSSDDIMTVYDLETTPDDSTNNMDSFNGESTTGTWTLFVADESSGISGTVEEWILWIQ